MWPSADEVARLREQWTDRWVRLDASRPEFGRFAGAVGQVKTVNMNGRALVEFAEHLANVGWYDVDVAALSVVAAPAPAAATKSVGSRPAKPKTGDAVGS
ncbi:MAG TPA: hypothetical protein VGE52_05720 [Pirellulales bacterium]